MLHDSTRPPLKSSLQPIARFRPFPLLSPKSILSPSLAKTAVMPAGTVSTTPVVKSGGKTGHVRMKSMQMFAPAVIGAKAESRQFPAHSLHARHLSFGEKPALSTSHIILDTVSHHSLRGMMNGSPKAFNQDTLLVFPSFQDDPTAYFLAICDGHGGDGHKVSKYLTFQLVKRAKEARGCGTLMKAIPEIIRLIQKDVCMSDKFEAAFSGSTLVSVAFVGGTLLVVNVGDSRAVLVSKREGRVITTALTTDHKPTLPGESDRIISHMGRIEPCYDSSGQPSGPARVWLLDEDLPGLAMSRSVGDSIAHQAGVTETPEVYLRPVQQCDIAIVLGSDGLWDMLSNDEVGTIVDDCLKRGEFRDCSLTLAKAAETRWKERGSSMDDVSVIVGFFHVI